MQSQTNSQLGRHSTGLDVKDAREHVNYVQLAVSAIVLVIAAQIIYLVVINEALEWQVFAQWFVAPPILHGLGVTLGLTAIAMTLGSLLGLAIAIMRLSSNRIASGFASLFNWFFRGTPLLVQLIFLYNLAVIFPQISLGIPFGPTFYSWQTNDLISPLTAAIIGLTLNEAAYMSEIIRGGLLSVDHGQTETAQAFGMSRLRTMWRIIIPQAMKAIIPPTGNQLISMVKGTSLVSVIAMESSSIQCRRSITRLSRSSRC